MYTMYLHYTPAWVGGHWGGTGGALGGTGGTEGTGGFWVWVCEKDEGALSRGNVFALRVGRGPFGPGVRSQLPTGDWAGWMATGG